MIDVFDWEPVYEEILLGFVKERGRKPRGREGVVLRGKAFDIMVAHKKAEAGND